MNWAIAGLVYSGACAALMTQLHGRDAASLMARHIALLLPPLAPLYVTVTRRRDWRGRPAVFWGAITAGAALSFLGQAAWTGDALLHATPWFKWPLVLQLCGSTLPLIALVAWPHRSTPEETASPVAIDIALLVFIAGFLYWSLIVAPIDHQGQAATLRAMTVAGAIVWLASLAAFLLAGQSASTSGWARVYQRLTAGMAVAVGTAVLSAMPVRNQATGSLVDFGWMVPFFFIAWAATTAPASPAATRLSPGRPLSDASPVLLFVALLSVPIVGYGLRHLMPLGEPLDTRRDIVTAGTLVGAMALMLARLRVEQRLAAQVNQRLRLLATACEQAGDLVIIVGRDGRIDYANDAFSRATGYTPKELESISPTTLLAAESAASVPLLNQSLTVGKVTRLTVSLARKDGGVFQAACVAAPIAGAGGRVTHFVAVIRDTTEELRLREQIVRGERLSALGEFVSGVAHEISNPLQSIIGSLELVLQQELETEVRSDIERARFEAGRAGRIVRNLLRFVRQAPNERLLLDLNEVVKATMSVRAYELEVAGIVIREDYAPNLALVLANRDDIQQVILNLVMNAQQAMSDRTGARVLSVRTFMAGGNAALEVRDTGPGIPPELAGKVFEPFFTTRSAGAGPGLGLSLSLGIATAHQGQLELVAAAVGCCFRLSLPGAGFPGPAHGPATIEG